MKPADTCRKICFATSTRADWGLLSPLARSLAARNDCQVDIIATNMHLSERFGMTVNDIIADGFKPVRVPIDATADSEVARAKAMAQCCSGFADAFDRLKPDMVVILGDRYEMLAVASAAAVMKIPIVHIAGGAISEGAVDDSIRHAITKLSALHLTETEEYRHRVLAMGEAPERVINTGAIGVWNILNVQLMSRQELTDSLEFDFNSPYVIATFHPATLDNEDPGVRCKAMLDALERHPELGVIITYPNNDAQSGAIIHEIEHFADRHSDRVKLVKSLGLRRFLSAMQFAEFSIGNSSSGIVEVASCGIPSIDIGIRQQGRAAAASVIHCGDLADDIDAAIIRALSPAAKQLAASRENPYYKPDTLRLMTNAIMNADPKSLLIKKFHDISIC